MIDPHDQLYEDFSAVQQNPIAQTMLEVICRMTGMGFAAVARVTDTRWLACSVKDDIAFGLKPGDELKLETTICNEIRDSSRSVIIDNVATDQKYLNHHTPKLYGFQSYISFPIFLKNGEFFGTICAIDPKPASLHDPAIIGLFTLFADLLSFHLQSLDLLDRSHDVLRSTSRELHYTREEVRQYRHISTHTLREPLRKIGLFSDLLVYHTAENEKEKAQSAAHKIQTFASQLSDQIRDISLFSSIETSKASFELVDLNVLVTDVCNQLLPQIEHKKGAFNRTALPTLWANYGQMFLLFSNLIRNALQYSRPDATPEISISCDMLAAADIPKNLTRRRNYFRLRVSDNGIGMESYRLDRIFDVFETFNEEDHPGSSGTGLSYCRKIVHQHGGEITVASKPGTGTDFFLVLPLDGRS